MQSKPCTPLLRRGACATGQSLAGGWGWGDGEEGAGGKEKGGLEGGRMGGEGAGTGDCKGEWGGGETRDAAAAAQPELLGRHKPLK